MKNSLKTRVMTHNSPHNTALATFILAASFGVSSVILASCGKKDEAKAADGPPVVNMMAENRASTMAAVTKVVALGRVEPEDQITELSLDVNGVVKNIFVKEGAMLKAGTPILEVLHDVESAKYALSQAKITTQNQDLKSLQAQAESARIKAKNQQEKYERLQKIFESGAETRQNLDNAKTDYETALREVERLEASVHSAASRLNELSADARVSAAEVERRILRAPVDGVVLKLLPNQGSAVASGKSVGDFAPKGSLTVLCEVDELFVNTVQIGQKAGIRLQGSAEVIAQGDVIEVGSYLKKKSLFSDEAGTLEDRRVREVRVRLDNAAQLLINSRVECVIQVK